MAYKPSLWTKLCPNCGSGMMTYDNNWLCPKLACKPKFTNFIGDQMKSKIQQRFGRISENFGDFGELRKQKKAPGVEVLYIPVKEAPKFPIGGDTAERQVETLRSINNSTTDQILDHIRKVGANIEAGNLGQASGEILLDRMYAELTKRQNAEAK